MIPKPPYLAWHTNPLSRLQHPKAQLGSTQNHLSFPKRSESPSFPNALGTITANTCCWHKPHETTPPKSRTRHPNQTLQISNKNNRPHNPPTTSPFPKPPYPHMPPPLHSYKPSSSHPPTKQLLLPNLKTSPQDPHFGAPTSKVQVAKKTPPGFPARGMYCRYST